MATIAQIVGAMNDNVNRIIHNHPSPAGEVFRSASEINQIISEIREANEPWKAMLLEQHGMTIGQVIGQ